MKYDVYTVQEAAKKIGVTPWTMYALIHEGVVKAYNVGYGDVNPRWRIKEEDLLSSDYVKHSVRHEAKKVVKKEVEKTRPKAIPKQKVDAKKELESLKNDLLDILLRIEELENKI